MASIEIFTLNPVDFAATGFVGEPGQREFYIQGTKSEITMSVLIEKQQLEQIANEAIRFLNILSQDLGDEIIATPKNFDDAELKQPVVSIFRARTISLVFDESTQLLTLVLRESDIDTDNQYNTEIDSSVNYSVIEETMVEDRVLRLTMTRTQLRALAVKGHLAIGMGREICQLCFLPKDPIVHLCPRMN